MSENGKAKTKAKGTPAKKPSVRDSAAYKRASSRRSGSPARKRGETPRGSQDFATRSSQSARQSSAQNVKRASQVQQSPRAQQSLQNHQASKMQPQKQAQQAQQSSEPGMSLDALRRKQNSERKASSHVTRRPSAKNGKPSARKHAKRATLFQRIVSSKAAIAVIAVVVVLCVAGGVDAYLNWGKAYANVSINGISVGGKTSEEMLEILKGEFGPRVSHAQVTIYANDAARAQAGQGLADEESRAIAEQISAEEAVSSIGSWTTDALSLKATVPYDDAIERAIAVGRADGGLATRFDLMFNPHDVSLDVRFDGESLENLASEIDRTIGDERIDTTVSIENGIARAVEGHNGTMIDREWLTGKISDAFIRDGGETEFVAQAVSAQSRISMDAARAMADSINRAIAKGATFTFQGKNWTAQPSDLGDWTNVDVVQEGDEFTLRPSIDSGRAIPAVIHGSGAAITSENLVVEFEKQDGNISVHTSGSANIPEVTPAIETLGRALYGDADTAWGQGGDISIEIAESDRPETLAFNDAVDLGVITVIGEYTTEFSNLEGTENRNHNIKLASDILNDAVIDANGGTWNFNERSGDTNEEAGFWSAGSIVDGEYVDSIGGGICQVATTIFNAVYEAGLDVVERHNHTLYIASYPTGRDAAVSYPDLDFIWKNDLKSDVLMKLSYTDTSVTAKLYSVYTGYKATSETGAWEEGATYSTRFDYDDSLGEGLYYLKTTGSDGSKISVNRTVTNSKGDTVKNDTFASVYAAKDEVYVIGPGVDTSALVHQSTPS